MITCSRCPSTATHYPRLYFHADAPPMLFDPGGPRNMRLILGLPYCAEHRTPFAESVLMDASHSPLSDLAGEIGEHFARVQGVPPDPLYTKVQWLPLDHPDVLDWLAKQAKYRDAAPAHLRNKPIVIQHGTFEELAEFMATAPDIALSPEED